MISTCRTVLQERRIGTTRVEFTVLNRMTRTVLTEKIVFEPRLEGDEGMSMEIFGETAFWAEESANAKTLQLVSIVTGFQ